MGPRGVGAAAARRRSRNVAPWAAAPLRRAAAASRRAASEEAPALIAVVVVIIFLLSLRRSVRVRGARSAAVSRWRGQNEKGPGGCFLPGLSKLAAWSFGPFSDLGCSATSTAGGFPGRTTTHAGRAERLHRGRLCRALGSMSIEKTLTTRPADPVGGVRGWCWRRISGSRPDARRTGKRAVDETVVEIRFMSSAALRRCRRQAYSRGMWCGFEACGAAAADRTRDEPCPGHACVRPAAPRGWLHRGLADLERRLTLFSVR